MKTLPSEREPYPHPVIFFDGVCNLCQSSVKFILKNERENQLQFTPLQSEFARNVLEPAGYDLSELSSMVFMEEGRLLFEARAALGVAKYLKAPWSLGRVFSILPDFILTPIYRCVARNRYNWFGKSEACMLPTPEISKRFLD